MAIRTNFFMERAHKGLPGVVEEAQSLELVRRCVDMALRDTV